MPLVMLLLEGFSEHESAVRICFPPQIWLSPARKLRRPVLRSPELVERLRESTRVLVSGHQRPK
eukprot:COSAG01_NODE_123_length_25210_cov_348.799434_15_plen_64_part_00